MIRFPLYIPRLQPVVEYRRYRPVGISALVGVALSVLAGAIVWQGEQEALQVALQQKVEDLSLALQSSLDEHTQVPRSLTAFFNASQTVSHEEFLTFSQPFLDHYSSIQGIAFSAPVRQSERVAFETAVRDQGNPSFSFHERTAQGELIRSPEHPIYFPVLVGAPADRYQGVEGYNLASDPALFPAIERARDTGKITATYRLTLLKQAGLGFAIFAPVYRKGSVLQTTADRRQALEGVVYSVYRLPSLVASALRGMDLKTLNFYLVELDPMEGDALLIRYDATQGQFLGSPPDGTLKIPIHPMCRHAVLCRRNLRVGDRRWQVIVEPTPAFIGQPWESLGTLVGGFFLTVCVAGYLWISLSYTANLEAAMQELKRTQAQLVQVEKMSGLGQLVAGIAHELNNPVGFIKGNVVYLKRYSHDLFKLLALYRQRVPPSPEIEALEEAIDLEFLREDFPGILASIQSGAERVQAIVTALRTFSRLDESTRKRANLHDGLDSTLMLLQGRLHQPVGGQGVTIVKEYGEIPLVYCAPGQLNQVFMNLLTNAIDALESRFKREDGWEPQLKDHPTLWIRTQCLEDKGVLITIRDNGLGMAEEIQKKIFDPFFTTKPVGQGTGLGLSICYQIIVENHQGVLRCTSAPGVGTEMAIELPISP